MLLNWQGSDQLLQKKNETDQFKDLAVGLSYMTMYPVLQSSMYSNFSELCQIRCMIARNLRYGQSGV